VSPLIGCWLVGRLERALANLVGNAAKYTPPEGEIVVATEREHAAGGDWAVISVRDEGLGISAADLPHIFEPFYRARNVAGRYEGAGLGLVGVRHTVEQHGGSISVASCEGQGSTFTIRLPLTSAS
jgi:two-component system, OmpR family, sensor histidine kinase BaeS